MPVLSVRERTDEDLAEAGEALVVVHHADGYPVEGVADPRAWLESDAMVIAFVALVDGRVIGHVAVSRVQPGDAAPRLYDALPTGLAMLGRLFVHPDHRRSGAARALMSAAQGYARRAQLRLLLDVMAKDVAAIRLYEQLGWTRLGEVEHHLSDGRVVPALALLSPEPSADLSDDASEAQRGQG